MVTSPTAAFPAFEASAVTTRAREWTNRGRRISAEAGRALEKLGHAIDYLTDEYIHKGGEFNSNEADFQAVEMLMALNLKVYFACPEALTLGERLQAWFSGRKS